MPIIGIMKERTEAQIDATSIIFRHKSRADMVLSPYSFLAQFPRTITNLPLMVFVLKAITLMNPR